MLNYDDYKKYAHTLDVKITKSNDNIISFTPYVYNSCSANCMFCSEKLARKANSDFINKELCEESKNFYIQQLNKVFAFLKGKNVFLSISGKEPTESLYHLQLLRDETNKYITSGGNIVEKVMYSNLSGFTKKFNELIEFCHDIKLTRIECSRHHFDEKINQEIVRFKPNEIIKENRVFSDLVQKITKNDIPVKVVCVMQKCGISNVEEIEEYIEFMSDYGISQIVFRELSMFENSIVNSKTVEYINKNRIELKEILDIISASTKFTIKEIKEGYYYYSFCYKYVGNKKVIDVVFEMSDYEEMIKHHNSNELNKIILYPNGNISKDWNIMKEILGENNA
ncbi:MAG: hypothetical protein IJ215_03605 [Clostridia bacterium]|nr:hypothetical protein [Clostridia bacterium]